MTIDPLLTHWRKKIFSLPSGVSPVICSTLIAHPWAVGVGQKQETGFYLSPENAIKHLVNKLQQANSTHDVLVMMLTAGTLDEFIQTLERAAKSFPLPELEQVSRKAKSYLSLANSKMQIPSALGGLPKAAPLSLSTARAASGAEQLKKALQQTGQGQSMASINKLMQQFTQTRFSALQQAQKQLEQLQSGYFPVWVHSTEKNTQLAQVQLLDNIPDSDHVFTLAMMFVGEDLTALRAMVAQDDN